MDVEANLLVVAGQVATLFLMVAMGFALAQFGMLTELGIEQMSNLLLSVVTPCIFLESFQQDNLPSLGVLLLSAIVLAGPYIIFMSLSHLLFLKAEPETAAVLRFGTVYGNSGSMGLPLLNIVLGPNALVFGVIAMACILPAG